MDDVELTRELCRLLAVIPGWEYQDDPAVAFTPGSVAVFRGPLAAAPDRAVGVRVYGGTDDRVSGLKTRRAQLRIRGGRAQPNGADELASAALAALQGLSRVGGISDIRRFSFGPAGADGNGREERTDNYTIILDNPEASS